MFYLSIDVDDANPSILAISNSLWTLNDLGYRVTAFVPANYKGRNNLLYHKTWTDWMKDTCEIQAHGLFHTGPNYGSCEFLAERDDVESRLFVMMEIYKQAGINPTVLRPPGWLHNANVDYKKYIKHLSIHDEADIEYINIHELREPTKEYVILHSHASPPADNDLSNPKLFKNLLEWLELYKERYTYITVGEMYDRVRGNP